ncbi:hypothetical protein [Caulobacter endophyticus]|uniref:hypothetical protein n=1 Tax=Caulobacter endophyticus TaxID=2172652 RepID=UPI00240ED200|nr:hypothetical protein [Caulobacter endophyticus]MDG2529345.1 hypothetical protein [Caulobacter endophyticus]
MDEADPRPSIELRPATSTLVVLGVLVSPVLVIGVVSWTYQVEQLIGAGMLALGALVWGSVATIRISVRNGLIVRKVFWRTTWSIASAEALIERGRGGGASFIPAVLIKRRSTGEKVGEILAPQFHAEALAAFAAAVEAGGGQSRIR